MNANICQVQMGVLGLQMSVQNLVNQARYSNAPLGRDQKN